MKDLMMLVALSVLVVLAGAGSAQAAVISEFATEDLEGWYCEYGSYGWNSDPGAGGDPGYLRNWSWMEGTSARNSTNAGFLGDLAAQHGAGGSEILLSFDFRFELLETGAYSAYEFRVFNQTGDPTAWGKNVASGPATLGQWYHEEALVDTAWTNAEAEANGWLNVGGPKSFSDTFAGVTLLTVDLMTTGQTTDVLIAGFDNIAIDAATSPPTQNRGDVTEDLFVGADDLVRILTHWGESGSVPWENGDIAPYGDGTNPGDDFVGADDYVEVLTYWGTTYPPEPGEAVPEPATLGVLLLGGLMGIVRRR